MNETFVGNTIRIRLNTSIDLSTYSDYGIKYKKPDGTTGVWVATLDSNVKRIYYDTAIADLDQAGVWVLQAEVLDGATVVLNGKMVNFTVYEPITLAVPDPA